MIYITHILLIMAAIWDIKKMEVPLTISVMLYLVHTCELLSSNYWKIDFIGMILCFSIFAFAMIWSNIGGADALIAGVIGYNLGLYGLYAIILALCICIPYLLYMHVKHKEHDYPFVPFLTVGYFILYKRKSRAISSAFSFENAHQDSSKRNAFSAMRFSF